MTPAMGMSRAERCAVAILLVTMAVGSALSLADGKYIVGGVHFGLNAWGWYMLGIDQRDNAA